MSERGARWAGRNLAASMSALAWSAWGAAIALGAAPAWLAPWCSPVDETAGLAAQALLAWLAVAAPALGVWVGASGVRLWPFGASVPASWALALGWCDLADLRAPITPLWAALAWSGLFALGFACGVRWREQGAALAFALLSAAALACALPVRAGLGPPSPAERWPALGARLLDLSPASLLFECAGVDWMRHPAIYQAAGSDWFSGERRPWRGPLAGPAVFVLGCAACAIATRRRKRRDAANAGPRRPLVE